ncbi:hypothetical protein ACN24M_00745 [Streptomyces microflavus]
MPDVLLRIRGGGPTARTTAQTAQASAILAVETALNLGVKLPLQIRRYVQEVKA